MFYDIEEYETLGGLTLTSADIRTITTVHKSHVTLQRTGDTFSLKANSWVGQIHLRNCTIAIHSKVPIPNLFYMLAYAYDLADFRYLRDLDVEDADNLFEILIFVFLMWVNQLIKKGLYRSYITREEFLLGIKGKIVPHKSSLERSRMYCNYGNLSHSTVENSIIKATLHYILRKNVNHLLKSKALSFIRIMGEIQETEITPAVFKKISYHKLNYRYRKIIDLCWEIYKASLFRDEIGYKQFSGFMIDMNRLFQEFLYAIIKENFDHVTKQSKRDFWAGGDTTYLPSIIPDIVIRDKLVIDAKYYRHFLTSNGKIRNDHIYQLFTYMSTLGIGAALIYPVQNLAVENLSIAFRFNNNLKLHIIGIDLSYKSMADSKATFLENLQSVVAGNTVAGLVEQYS